MPYLTGLIYLSGLHHQRKRPDVVEGLVEVMESRKRIPKLRKRRLDRS
jgi:hypothetical protein